MDAGPSVGPPSEVEARGLVRLHRPPVAPTARRNGLWACLCQDDPKVRSPSSQTLQSGQQPLPSCCNRAKKCIHKPTNFPSVFRPFGCLERIFVFWLLLLIVRRSCNAELCKDLGNAPSQRPLGYWTRNSRLRTTVLVASARRAMTATLTAIRVLATAPHSTGPNRLTIRKGPLLLWQQSSFMPLPV